MAKEEKKDEKIKEEKKPTTTKKTRTTKKVESKKDENENKLVEKENTTKKTTTKKSTTTAKKKTETTTKKATSKGTTAKATEEKKSKTPKAATKKTVTEKATKTSENEETKKEEEKTTKTSKNTTNKTTKKKTTKSASTKKEDGKKSKPVENEKKARTSVKGKSKKEITEDGEVEEVAATVEEKADEKKEEKSEKLIKISDIKNAIKNKKTIPEEQLKKINTILFRNIIIAVAVIVYFLFLNLGYINIKNDIYITDLKVFSACILLIAIALIEYAYKKDSGEFALYGVEMIILSIVSVSLLYVNLMLSSRYMPIAAAISFIFAIYYLIKTIIIYFRKRKQYFVNDIKEIIKEEE